MIRWILRLFKRRPEWRGTEGAYYGASVADHPGFNPPPSANPNLGENDGK